MPHVAGEVTWANQSGGNFAPDSVSQGIDTRGGFILLTREKNALDAKDSSIDILDMFRPEARISFDYSEVESGGDMKAGYYYGVKNLRELS